MTDEEREKFLKAQVEVIAEFVQELKTDDYIEKLQNEMKEMFDETTNLKDSIKELTTQDIASLNT